MNKNLPAIDRVRHESFGGIVSSTDPPFLAWVLIVIECGLGTALLLFYRPRISLGITAFLLLVFIVATAWTWYTGGAEDCGCFGMLIKRTPKVTIIEDLVLLIILCFSWICHRRSKIDRNADKSKIKFFLVIAALLAGLYLPFASGFPLSGLLGNSLENNEKKLEPFDIIGVDDSINLDSGTYLLVLMSVDCEHCWDAVPEINELTEYDDLPQIIALSFSGPDERQMFVDDLGPVYPVAQIDEEVFWRLLGDGDVPLFILVHDRYVKMIWDYTTPTVEDILAIGW